MKEELITFETAKLAKEKGFDWYDDDTVCAGYDGKNDEKNVILSPTQSLLQKWLRETHKLHCSSDCNASGWFWQYETIEGTFIKDWEYGGPDEDSGMWETYEEALEKGLQEALKLIK